MDEWKELNYVSLSFETNDKTELDEPLMKTNGGSAICDLFDPMMMIVVKVIEVKWMPQ